MRNRLLLTLLLSFTLFLSACSQKANCGHLPQTFSSYQEAIKQIKSATFKIKEEANTVKSSWIRGASYFSCDGKTGYFLFKTEGKEYIHTGVPFDIWQGFKRAESFGSFYNKNIKHKYILLLN